MFTRSMYSVLSYTPYMYLLSIICLTTYVREVCPGAHVTKMLYPSISLLVCSWVTLELKSVKTRIFDAAVVIDSVCEEKGVLCPRPVVRLDARIPKSHV